MSGRPIMIRRVGIAWLVSPLRDLHPHDAGEKSCGQTAKWAKSKIEQTRCLLLWISDSPFRIIDGGSCSISLVVNQSVGGIFNPHSLTQDLPSLSMIEQTRFAYRLHATWKYVLSGNAQHATVQRLSDLFFIWYKAATICTTWFNIQNKLLLSGKFFRLHWPLIPHPGGEALSAYVDKHSLHTWGEYFGEGVRVHELAF